MNKRAAGEYLKDYSLLKYARDLRVWSKAEEKQLDCQRRSKSVTVGGRKV
jgi:hypothetical protein